MSLKNLVGLIGFSLLLGVVVQHDAEDFRSLPKFPAYLD